MNKWDKEYSTEYWEEVVFLREHGVRYTFVRKGVVPVYKYTKTKQLFELLTIFYNK